MEASWPLPGTQPTLPSWWALPASCCFPRCRRPAEACVVARASWLVVGPPGWVITLLLGALIQALRQKREGVWRPLSPQLLI